MRMFNRGVSRKTWAEHFASSEIGFSDGQIGIQVPGLLSPDGSANNRGNVIVAIPTDQAEDMLAELENGPRSLTAAEMVRRTFDLTDNTFSFKVSNAPGTRTVSVPAGAWPTFLALLAEKIMDAAELMAEADRLTAEAAAE